MPPTLTRAKPKTPPALPLLEGLSLTHARAHEACGPSRLVFAALTARATQGPILWIRPAYGHAHLNPDGLAPWCDPSRLLIVDAPRAPDLLWAAEEGLRIGHVPLIVVEMPQPPALTPVRRLHLAAETGREVTGQGPICLLLTPGQGGAQGIESRWHIAPVPGWATAEGHPNWALKRTRARLAPEAAWRLSFDGLTPHLHPASEKQADAPGPSPQPSTQTKASATSVQP